MKIRTLFFAVACSALSLLAPEAQASLVQSAPAPQALSVPVVKVQPAFDLGGSGTRVSPIRVALDAPSMPKVDEQTSTLELEATAMYRLGLFQMTEGKFDSARDLFIGVKNRYPGTPAANAADARLIELEQAFKAKVVRPGDNRNGGRAEFVVTETLFGGYLGGLLTVMGGFNGSGGVLLPMLGLAGGLGGSLLYSEQNPVNVSQAAQFRAAQLITLANLTGWTLGLAPEFLAENFTLLQTVGLVGGTVAGHFLSRNLPMPEGQVAFVTSAAVWTPLIFESLLVIIGDLNIDARVYALTAPLMTDLAVAGAMWLCTQDKIRLSRDRMVLINLGGGLGATFASGLVILAEGFGSARASFAAVTLGAIAGLGIGYYATQSWDATNNPGLLSRSDSPSLLTVEDGRLKLGRFMPTIRPEVQVTQVENEQVRKTGTAFQVGLLGGAF